jgi:hypothetical protein
MNLCEGGGELQDMRSLALADVEEVVSATRPSGVRPKRLSWTAESARGDAESSAASAVKASTSVAGSDRRCRFDEEAFKVLGLTTIKGGVRVDYEFVRSGQASWTAPGLSRSSASGSACVLPQGKNPFFSPPVRG